MYTPSSYYHTTDVRTLNIDGNDHTCPVRMWFLEGELVDADPITLPEVTADDQQAFESALWMTRPTLLEIIAEQTSADDLAELDRCARVEHYHRHHPTNPNAYADGRSNARALNAFHRLCRADERKQAS